jgi:23S rRNA (pseudouridine1915-N3)-methyltransferase
MQIVLLAIGKTQDAWMQEAESRYLKRIGHYAKIQTEYLQSPAKWNSLSPELLMKQEAAWIREKCKPGDCCVLLDEKGKTYTSESFAKQLEKWQNTGAKRLVFIIGGAWGLDPELKQEISAHFSLSSLTFTHQMVRFLLLEQLYRAFTILKNEPYHNS